MELYLSHGGQDGDREIGVRDSTVDTTRIDDVRIGAVRPLLSVTFWPSGSVAEPVTETVVPDAPLAVGGAVIVGTRFRFAIVRAVVAAAVPPAPSFALQFTV